MHCRSLRSACMQAPPTKRCTCLPTAHCAAASWPSKRRGLVRMAASSGDEAICVVQKQLEAYNARDLEAFMSIMADDVLALDAETGQVIASSAAELRPRYIKRFETPVHCELLGRLACGDTVVDRERITGLPDGASADCIAIYTVKDGKIKRMQLLWKALQ